MKRVFTLIEMTVVMSIIATLALVVVPAAFTYLEKSRVVKTQADMVGIKTAVTNLYMDTSRFLLGCPPFENETLMAPLDDSWSGTLDTGIMTVIREGYWVGLIGKPTHPDSFPPDPYGVYVNLVGSKCKWKQAHIDSWQGPYVENPNLRDYWGRVYVYDTAYNCSDPSITSNQCTSTSIAKTSHTIDLLKENGSFLKMPHSKKIKVNLYELRIRGEQEIRIFYTFKKRNIYLLHAFQKKSQKTPKKEIQIALKRLKLLTLR